MCKILMLVFGILLSVAGLTATQTSSHASPVVAGGGIVASTLPATATAVRYHGGYRGGFRGGYRGGFRGGYRRYGYGYGFRPYGFYGPYGYYGRRCFWRSRVFFNGYRYVRRPVRVCY